MTPTDKAPNMKTHNSDCALHNGPAYEPKPCDCGAEPGLTPEEYGSEFPAPKPGSDEEDRWTEEEIETMFSERGEWKTALDAATDRLEELRASNAKLREALELAVRVVQAAEFSGSIVAKNFLRKADAALKETE